MLSPIQTYQGRESTNHSLIVEDHGIIYTSKSAPDLSAGESTSHKIAIQVQPTGGELLQPEARINYAKKFAVEHHVQVVDIGMVVEEHKHLLHTYSQSS
jgi:hypothetical protein